MTDLRPWTHAALFGGLWGAVECTAGTALKMTPGVPGGAVLASAAVLCMVTARRLAPAPGATLAAGLTALLVMTFSLGGLRPGSLVAVLAQALVMELALTATGNRWPGAVAGGAIAIALAPVQKALVVFLVAGPEAARTVLAFGHTLLDRIGLSGVTPGAALAGLVALAAVAGAVVGALAWRLAGRVARRTGGLR